MNWKYWYYYGLRPKHFRHHLAHGFFILALRRKGGLRNRWSNLARWISPVQY